LGNNTVQCGRAVDDGQIEKVI